MSKPSSAYRALADLAEDLRSALRVAERVTAVDSRFSAGLQEGLRVAIEFIEKRKR